MHTKCQRIWSIFGPSKGPKTCQFSHFCHFFKACTMPREAMEDLPLELINEAQSKTQMKFWRVDTTIFPTSHHGANSDIRKSIKTWLQVDPISVCRCCAFRPMNFPPCKKSTKHTEGYFRDFFGKTTLDFIELCLCYLSFIPIVIMCLEPCMASLYINEIYGVFMDSRSLLVFPTPHLMIK